MYVAWCTAWIHICYRDTHPAPQKLSGGVRLRNGRVSLHLENRVIIIAQGLRLVRQHESREAEKAGTVLGLRVERGGGEGGGGRRQLLACPQSLPSCRPALTIWPGAGARSPSVCGS